MIYWELLSAEWEVEKAKCSQNGIWVGKLISHDTCAEDVANLRVYLFGRHPFRWQGMACAFEIIWRTLLWSVLGVIWDLHPRLLLYLYIHILYMYKNVCVLQLNFENWHWIPSTWNRPVTRPRHFHSLNWSRAAVLPPSENESRRFSTPKGGVRKTLSEVKGWEQKMWEGQMGGSFNFVFGGGGGSEEALEKRPWAWRRI